ncbi:hypothetical protein [Gordonia sputi]|uniref:Uncharacterized protein n=1 Tax=Gordonia sputi NBRC 100414 TaxID=1089453 RepID=H5U417_9ACTN|nr:hypothetical protein [Gordonia sputi]NKY92383.1 hypothetical protein [Gordonia sputi]GAB40475.1 hypothetical protein GOSPT_103_00520 [Gordonia sputi NBRC 100414]
MRTDPHRPALIERRSSPVELVEITPAPIERHHSLIERGSPLIELVEITQPAAEGGLDSGARFARARSTSGPRMRRPSPIVRRSSLIVRRSPLIELVEITPAPIVRQPPLIEHRPPLIELVEITPAPIVRQPPLIELVEITPPQTLQPARNARQHRGMTACFAP